MDFKKFGFVLLILGAIIISISIFQFGIIEINKNKHLRSISNPFHKEQIKVEAAQKRKQTVYILAAGGIIAFVGGGMRYSSKN